MPKKKAEGHFTPHISIACSGDTKRAADSLAHALDNAYLSVHDNAVLPEWNVAEIVALLTKLTEAAWAAKEKR